MQKDKNKVGTKGNKKEEIIKPDPETLHTTDPEEHMRGPISSLMQDIKEDAEKEDLPKKKKHT